MYGNMGYGYNPFGTILMILVWIIIICAIVWIIRRRRGFLMMHHHGRWGRQDAVDILRERYAKGEINAAEFEERKTVLMKDFMKGGSM